MKTCRSRNGVLLSALIVLSAGFLLSCSDDDPVSGGNNSAMGQVLLLLHDAPIGDLTEVWITVTSVRLIGGDADSASETVLAEPVRFDLLTLDSLSRVLALAEVPSGAYSKIRFEISDPLFVEAGDDTVDASDIQIVANGKVDLNFQGPVMVDADSITLISADFDAEQSIRVNQTGNGKYILHPQIKIDAENEIDDEGEVELHRATVLSVDVANGRLVVGMGTLSGGITVFTDPGTEILDENDQPITLADLTVGTVVEIKGYLNPVSGEIVAVEIKIED